MADFSELYAPSLKEMFVRQLEDMILSGSLKIGEKLPPERELAKSMRISRSVVNAGLTEMATKGFIELRPRSGAYVSDYRRNGTMETLVSIINYKGGVFLFHDLVSLIQFRCVLKKLALELAAEHITAEEIDEAAALVKRLYAAQSSAEAAELATTLDHNLTVYSGNTFLPLMFSSFRKAYLLLMERYFRIDGMQKLYADMENDICQSLRAHDVRLGIETVQKGTDDALALRAKYMLRV